MFGLGMWPKPFVYPRLPFASPVELFLTQQTYYSSNMPLCQPALGINLTSQAKIVLCPSPFHGYTVCGR